MTPTPKNVWEPSFRTEDAAALAKLLAAAAELGVELTGVKGRPSRSAETGDEEPDEDADTILFPAKPDGIAFLERESAWQSIRLSERTRVKIEDGTIKNAVAYAVAPGPQAAI